MVQARYLGDTSLVADIYGQGNLLGSKEAKGVMFKFQAVSDLLGIVDPGPEATGDGVLQSSCIGLIGDGSSVMAGRLTQRDAAAVNMWTLADNLPIPPDLWAWKKLETGNSTGSDIPLT